MRAGSFRKYFATHNPVRLFPEEHKRTRSNIVTDAKSINDFEAESRKPSEQRFIITIIRPQNQCLRIHSVT